MQNFIQNLNQNDNIESLIPYPMDTNNFDLMMWIANDVAEIENKDFLVQIKILTELRRLCRFKRDLFISLINSYKFCEKVIPQMINSHRLNLSKSAILLVSEIFLNFEYDYTDSFSIHSWLQFLIPEILNKSALDSKIVIKEESFNCLNVLTENIFYDETILFLMDGVLSQNLKLSENSINFILRLINNYEYFLLDCSIGWNSILLKLIQIFQMKRESYVRKCIRIVSAFEDKFGKENFGFIVKQNLEENKDYLIFSNIMTHMNVSRSKSKTVPKFYTNLCLNLNDNQINNNNLNSNSNQSKFLSIKERIINYHRNKENINSMNSMNSLNNLFK